MSGLQTPTVITREEIDLALKLLDALLRRCVAA